MEQIDIKIQWSKTEYSISHQQVAWEKWIKKRVIKTQGITLYRNSWQLLTWRKVLFKIEIFVLTSFNFIVLFLSKAITLFIHQLNCNLNHLTGPHSCIHVIPFYLRSSEVSTYVDLMTRKNPTKHYNKTAPTPIKTI